MLKYEQVYVLIVNFGHFRIEKFMSYVLQPTIGRWMIFQHTASQQGSKNQLKHRKGVSPSHKEHFKIGKKLIPSILLTRMT